MRPIIKRLPGIMISGLKNSVLRKMEVSLKPRWLNFSVTDRCNSRCKHCNIWRKRPTKDPLTPKDIANMLSDPLFNKVEYVINTGGEAILRKDIKEIILLEHNVLPKAKIQLSTNGLLPERVIEVVEFAVKHDIDIEVGVSLDGIGESHDLMRGVEGNFEKTDMLLRKLAKLRREHGRDRVDPGIAFLLSDLTVSFLKDVKDYAQRLRMDLLVQWYDETSYYDNIGKKLSANSNNLIKATQSLGFGVTYEMWLKSLRGISCKFPCFAMNTFCVISCSGDIIPCLSLFDFKVGNVRENSPSSIWHSHRAQEARKLVKNCSGCLNKWAVDWSLESSILSFLKFFIKYPSIFKKGLLHVLEHQKRYENLENITSARYDGEVKYIR